MIWSLRYFKVSASVVSDFTIYVFDPSSSDFDITEYKLERYRQLDIAQSRVVCRFLRFMAENDGYADTTVASAALAAYWGQFCE